MVRGVLICHGENEHNNNDAITGQIDVGLNEYGVKQAGKAAEDPRVGASMPNIRARVICRMLMRVRLRIFRMRNRYMYILNN